MKYDISKATAPAMPTLGSGAESIKLLLSEVSKDMQEPLVPLLFPVWGRKSEWNRISVSGPKLEVAMRNLRRTELGMTWRGRREDKKKPPRYHIAEED